MTPSLEAILLSGQTVALNVAKASAGVAEREFLFKCRGLNRTVIFKYPNFDAHENPFASAASRRSGGTVRRSFAVGRRPIRTAIYIPHDAGEVEGGGFALFADDPDAQPLMVRHIGLAPEGDPAHADDWRILRLLMDLPSLDPFLVENAFRQAGIEAHPAYLAIDHEDADVIRESIADKVKPIIARAVGRLDPAKLDGRARRFVDAIWDDSQTDASQFITAFGITEAEAPAIFSAWKGVAFFAYEFDKNRAELKQLMAWLASKQSLPVDSRLLPDTDRHLVGMLRDSIRDSAKTVVTSMIEVLKRYDEGYATLIDQNDPRVFRDFLLHAPNHFWTLGACNAAMAQAITTWRRYMRFSRGGALTFEHLERLFQVCNKILKGQSGGVGDLN